MSRVKAVSSPASPPLTSGSVGVMVEKRRYRSNRYRLIPVSAVYTRGERLHKIRDRPSKTLKKLSILLNTSADYILGLTDKETLRLDELSPNDQLRIKAILQTFKNLNLPS